MNSCKILVRCLSMAASKLNLKGIYVPIITPFSEKGEIDFNKMEFNIKKFEKEVDLTGYAVGSNSEKPFLTPSERIEIVKVLRKLIKSDKMILGAATAESTKLSIEMAKAMADVGANGLLVMTPFYFRMKMTNEAIIKHFETLADHSPIPVVIYNSMMTSGIDVSLDVLKKLADHPNIRGVKDCDIRKMTMTALETKGKDFDVLAASAGYLLPTMQLGASGGIVALAGPLGPEVCKLVTLIQEKKWEEAIALQTRLVAVDVVMFCTHFYGVPGVKAAMKLKGFEPGYCRAPLKDLTEKETNHIKEVFQTYGFL